MGIEPGTTEQRRSNARRTTRPTVVWLTKMLEERHSFQHRHCNSRLHNVNMYYSKEQPGSRKLKKKGMTVPGNRISNLSIIKCLINHCTTAQIASSTGTVTVDCTVRTCITRMNKLAQKLKKGMTVTGNRMSNLSIIKGLINHYTTAQIA